MRLLSEAALDAMRAQALKVRLRHTEERVRALTEQAANKLQVGVALSAGITPDAK
jgi:hypothetical protein